jgi:hypothetical protein
MSDNIKQQRGKLSRRWFRQTVPPAHEGVRVGAQHLARGVEVGKGKRKLGAVIQCNLLLVEQGVEANLISDGFKTVK